MQCRKRQERPFWMLQQFKACTPAKAKPAT